MSSVTKDPDPEAAAVDNPKRFNLKAIIAEAALVDSSPPRFGGNSTSAADIHSKKPLLLVKKKNGYSILFFYDRKLDRVSLTADLDGK